MTQLAHYTELGRKRRKEMKKWKIPHYVDLPKRIETEINIPLNIWMKMKALIAICPIEIQWYCHITEDKPNRFYLHDIVVPKQTCGPATTTVFAEDMPIGKPRYFWGHSHATFAVFASGQDEDQYRENINLGKRAVMFIMNKKGETLCRYGTANTVSDMKINIFASPVNQSKIAQWAYREYHSKVNSKY